MGLYGWFDGWRKKIEEKKTTASVVGQAVHITRGGQRKPERIKARMERLNQKIVQLRLNKQPDLANKLQLEYDALKAAARRSENDAGGA